jgi:hypothetical protein
MRTSILVGAVIVTCYSLILMERNDDGVANDKQLFPAASQLEPSEEHNRASSLEKQQSIVRARIEFTRHVARELIAQRLTLWQAAIQLRDLDSSLSPLQQDVYDKVFLQLYPGASPEERYCQRALAVVDSELVLRSVQRPAILQRLRDELQRELRSRTIPQVH